MFIMNKNVHLSERFLNKTAMINVGFTFTGSYSRGKVLLMRM